jgi:pimeloyl-ACP methyl ester carboxylesterase
MADHIDGPLYYERMGRTGPVMAFVHPNPMDQSCWMFQMAHMSTWFRCIAIDIPGYGRSPKARDGLTVADMAEACWEAVETEFPEEPAILVGCSVGAIILPYMHHARPHKAKALIMCGTGYNPGKEFTLHRIKQYMDRGIGYRWDYTFEDLSPAFRQSQLAMYFADLFAERSSFADRDSIVRQFRALKEPDAPDHYERVACPSIILTGSEDGIHKSAFALQEQIPNCELRVLHGAGHACHMEQPWLFDRFMVEFLTDHGLFPAAPAR